MSDSRCITYIATGKAYIDEAFFNARLSKVNSPTIPFCLFTDLFEYALSINHDLVFENIYQHDCPVFNYRDKISPLLHLPYDEILFLDTDAFISSSIDLTFNILKFYDIAACYAPVRHPPGWNDASVPDFFPEINTGVLFFNNSPSFRQLVTDWLASYDLLFTSFNQSWDQASFRSVLWKAISNRSLSLFILPDEFNVRTTKPWIIGRGSPAYIIHGRYPSSELSRFLDYLNGDVDTFRTSSIWLTNNPHSSIRPRFDRTFE
ncbi:hypothetical protein [Synechococcus sp. BL107]|uniref:hypothetical protein n=1 Tax=Synechococcus sp. BL107 TaxID=313625 RepID=UPI0012EAEE4B|nr:hypothetical protein [Synechococcus sp. BL107]